MAGGHGGRREGAGRRKGTATGHNAATRTLRAMMEAAETDPGAPQLTAVEYLRACYRDPDMPVTLRLQAASQAIPFESPRNNSDYRALVGRDASELSNEVLAAIAAGAAGAAFGAARGIEAADTARLLRSLRGAGSLDPAPAARSVGEPGVVHDVVDGVPAGPAPPDPPGETGEG